MEYKILVEFNPKNLEEAVQVAIKAGWGPFGAPIAVAGGNNLITWAQAMTRTIPKTGECKVNGI